MSNSGTICRPSSILIMWVDGLGWIQVHNQNDATHRGVIAMDRRGDPNTSDLYFSGSFIYEVYPLVPNENLEEAPIHPPSSILVTRMDSLGWIQVENQNDATHRGVLAMDRTGDSNTSDLYFSGNFMYELHSLA